MPATMGKRVTQVLENVVRGVEPVTPNSGGARRRRLGGGNGGGGGKRKGIEFFGWTGAVISLGTHTQARTHTHAERRTHTQTHLQAFL